MGCVHQYYGELIELYRVEHDSLSSEHTPLIHTFQTKIRDLEHSHFPLLLALSSVSLVNKDINLMITKPIYIQTLSPEYTKEKQSEELG